MAEDNQVEARPGDESADQDDKSGQVTAKSNESNQGQTEEQSKAPSPEQLQKMISELRKENANYRTKAKAESERLKSVMTALGLKEDQESPEQQVQRYAQSNAVYQFHTTVLSKALENGVSKEGLDYFEYLAQRGVSGLEEGEELSEETWQSYAAEARSKSGRQSATSSIPSGTGSGAAPKPSHGGGLTVEAFAKMGILEKGKIYNQNPQLYKQLWDQALDKKLI